MAHFLGLFFGGILAGFFGDNYGRRKAYILAEVVHGGVWLISSWATAAWQIILVRFIAGAFSHMGFLVMFVYRVNLYNSTSNNFYIKNREG